MFRWGLLLVAMVLPTQILAEAKLLNSTVTGIKRDPSGDLILELDHQNDKGGFDHITLRDTDGVATLAATQAMMVREIIMHRNDYKALSELYSPKLMAIQKDALDKAIVRLEREAEKNKGPGAIGTKLTLESAKEMRGRCEALQTWTLENTQEMGSLIRSIRNFSGPYSYERNGAPSPKKGSLNGDLLDGVLEGNLLAPTFFIEHNRPTPTNHRWLMGNMDAIKSGYEGELKPHGLKENDTH